MVVALGRFRLVVGLRLQSMSLGRWSCGCCCGDRSNAADFSVDGSGSNWNGGGGPDCGSNSNKYKRDDWRVGLRRGMSTPAGLEILLVLLPLIEEDLLEEVVGNTISCCGCSLPSELIFRWGNLGMR